MEYRGDFVCMMEGIAGYFKTRMSSRFKKPGFEEVRSPLQAVRSMGEENSRPRNSI